MRDIKPARRAPVPEDEDIELFEISGALKQSRATNSSQPKPARAPAPPSAEAPPTRPPRKKRRPSLAGAKVPVATIHVPDAPANVHSDVHHHEEGGTAAPVPAAQQPKTKQGARGRVGHNERTMLLVFFALVAVASIVAAVIFLPTATVSLHLRTAPLLVDEEVVVGSTESASAEGIRGTAFFRDVTTTGAVPVEHTETVGTIASGSARIINRSGTEQPIREQSRLATADGQIFLMQTHAIIPPNSSTIVPIKAAEAGPAGNIEPQQLVFAALDENSQRLVYAEVEETLTGGTGEVIATVSENDIERARQNAGERARAQVENDIRGQLPEGWVILEESWTGQLSSFEPKAQVGDTTPELGYSAQVTVRVMGFEQTELVRRLEEVLTNRLEEEFMLFPGPISYTKSVKDVNWEEGTIRLLVRVTHTTIPRFSLDTLREKLAGRSVEEAKTYLEGLPGVRSVEIDLWPFWTTSIPRVEGRIALELEPERQP